MYLSVTNDFGTLYVTNLNSDKSLSVSEIKEYPLEIFTNGINQESVYRSLVGNIPLNRIEFNTVSQYNKFKQTNSKIQGQQLFNVIEPCYQFISKEYKNGTMDVKPRYWYLDIETGLDNDGFASPKKANAPITLIQIAESDTKMKYIFGMQEYITDREDVKYFWFDDEFTMLQAFLTLYLRRQPGVTTAWNGDGFDFPYIVNRYAKYDINPEAFSMFNTLEDHKTVIFGQHDTIKKPVGCYWVDTMEVYKKLFPGSRESWGLDYIAKYEKIEGKLNWKDEGFKSFKDFLEGNYSPEVDMVKGELWRLYNLPRTPEIEVAMKKQCYKLFVEYGIRDVDVLLEMDNNKKMLDLLMTLSWTMRCNLYDVFGTTKPWTIFIYNDLIEQNIALPNKPSMENREYGGGFVCATPGIFEWILIEDYASLYPNIMIQKGLSPESYVPENEIPSDLFALIKSTGIYRHIECDRIYMELDDKIKQQLSDLLIKYDLTMGVNGTCYRRSVNGVIPRKVGQIYKERKFHKKKKEEAEAIVEMIKRELEARGVEA